MKSAKWRKVLYEKQDYPDNYVDFSFLNNLKRNLHTRTYSYLTLAVNSGIVTQQLSSVSIFMTTFIYMERQWLCPHALATVTSLATLLFYFFNSLLFGERSCDEHLHRTYIDDVKTAILFLGISFVLSPVLVSLTETISTDTIYAMTAVMLLANLCCHDYIASDSSRVPGAFSLSTATFASVCLASRLHSAWHAFATVTFSFELFALWPMFRRKLHAHFDTTGQLCLTAVTAATALLCLVSVSTVAAILFSAAVVFLTFLCPAWLCALQPYKNNIHGPWDEAELKEDVMVEDHDIS